MKKIRKKKKLDPEIRYMIKHVWDKPRTDRKKWLLTFTRVNNRKRTHTYEDALAAGYPMAEFGKGVWSEVHAWCKEKFGPGYIWFGHRFFFLNEDFKNQFVKQWGTP